MQASEGSIDFLCDSLFVLMKFNLNGLKRSGNIQKTHIDLLRLVRYTKDYTVDAGKISFTSVILGGSFPWKTRAL